LKLGLGREAVVGVGIWEGREKVEEGMEKTE
jgi:hypothetical protein